MSTSIRITAEEDAQEERRLIELRKYNILDTVTEKDYENITRMASLICDVPIALISFVDENRQWFKSHLGLRISETEREYSFCAHALNPLVDLLIVPDSRIDQRFANNPYVTGDPNIVFYAGIPLVNQAGYTLGTVCVIDKRPRQLTPEQLEALQMLSTQVINLLELRKTNVDLLTTSQHLQLALKAGKLGSYQLDIPTGDIKTSALCNQHFGLDPQVRFDLTRLVAMILPEDREYMLHAIKQSIDLNIPYDVEYRIVLADGSVRWIHASGLPVYGDDGRAIRMAGVTANITDQKLSTSQLEKKVMERTNELDRKNAELETINKELQSFAYVSSHDLQEPLRKIQTFSSLIVDKDYENLSSRAKDYFDRMQNAAERMQRLIDDLLSYSRTNNAALNLEIVDLTALVHAVAKDMKEEIENSQSTINAKDLGPVKVIPFQCKQLLQNLFSNSIKFSQPDVPLTISVTCKRASGNSVDREKLSAAGNYYHIQVKDNGIGFEQQYSKRIFELFERLHGRYEYAGTGVGLAIVKKIVENHNGMITATSAPNMGATFDIFLPVID